MVSVNGADALGLGYSRLTPALVRGGKDACAGLESSVPLEVQLSRGTATELKSWQDQLCPFVRSQPHKNKLFSSGSSQPMLQILDAVNEE